MCEKWLCVEINYLPSVPSRVICFLELLCSGNLSLGSTESQRWNDWADRAVDSKC